MPFERTRDVFDNYFIGQTKKEKGTKVMIMEELASGEVKGLSVYSEATSFSTHLNKSLLTSDLIVIDKNSRGTGLVRSFLMKLFTTKKKT
jgi:hypothetical protein